MDIQCHQCGKTENDTHLSKCRVCFQYFCEEHARERGGVAFCSEGCGTTFFNPDPDEAEGE
jgi:hypothetical protein